MINSIPKSFICILLSLIPILLSGAVGHAPVVITPLQDKASVTLDENAMNFLSRKNLEKKIGRKLSLKERLAVMLLRKKLIKETQRKVFHIPPSQLDTGVEGCSIIFFRKDDLKIEAKIIDINNNEVTYQVCDDEESPQFKVAMRKITHIYDERGRVVYGNKSIRRDYIAPNKLDLDSTIEGCSKIYLFVGDLQIKARNIRMEGDEVLYELCDDPDSTTQGLYLNKVSLIEDRSGKIIYGERNANGIVNNYSRRKAKSALIVGIASIPLTFFYGIGFILGIIAWVIGDKALKRIKSGAEPDLDNSRKKALIGKILGMISVFSFILIILAVIWFLLLLGF